MFKEPVKDLYLEDHLPGSVYVFGSIPVEEKEVIDFATRYDPQVFHVDPEAAKRTSFGGLIASGWHTVALAMRLLVDHRLSRMANMGSPGVDDLRWLKPVRPGDILSVRLTILEARRSQSKPDRGIVRGLVEVLNQGGEVLAIWKGVNIVLCRNGRCMRRHEHRDSTQIPHTNERGGPGQRVPSDGGLKQEMSITLSG